MPDFWTWRNGGDIISSGRWRGVLATGGREDAELAQIREGARIGKPLRLG
jgi:hypothetical protein